MENGEYFDEDATYQNCLIEQILDDRTTTLPLNDVTEPSNDLKSNQSSTKTSNTQKTEKPKHQPNNNFEDSRTLPTIPLSAEALINGDDLNHTSIKAHLQSVSQEISMLDHRIEHILLHKHNQRQASNTITSDQSPITSSTSGIYRVPVDTMTKSSDSIETTLKTSEPSNQQKRRLPQFPYIPPPIESDTEHIYETIPEDSELEPIYCAPYKSNDEPPNAVEQWLKMSNGCQNGNFHRPCSFPATQKQANWTAKSNSSADDHENSSSAYNTGGSCNSNTLTLELNLNTDGKDQEQYRSTLVLCDKSKESRDGRSGRDRDGAADTKGGKGQKQSKKDSGKGTASSPKHHANRTLDTNKSIDSGSGK